MQSPRAPRWNLSHWAIDHPRFTIGFWLAIAVAGLLAFSSLKYALFPEVSFPVVIVQSSGTGLDLTQTEQKLTVPLEEKLLTIADADVQSFTYPGQTVVSVIFLMGQSLEEATTAVEQSLRGVMLPADSDMTVSPYNLNESVAVTYAVASEQLSLEEMAGPLREKIIPQLQGIDGVLRVDLLGDANFRPPGIKASAAQTINPPTLTRHNGQDVLAVQMVKTAQANTLEVVNRVEQLIAQQTPNFPQLEFIEAETTAGYIREATQATIDALLGAILLAVLIIYPFLRSIWATLISAIAIPLSLLGTFIVMAVLGFNLETLTLLALALIIGIVVDDAIVDVENIARHVEAGEPPKRAAKNGTQEIGLTVSATTFSIVVVFLPIALLGGTLGEFFFPFAVTVSAAVLVSLLVARTLSPVLTVLWLRPQPQRSTSWFSRGLDAFGDRYQRILAWSLGHRWWIIVLALASLMGGLAIIPLIPQGFIPNLDRGEFNVIFQSAPPKIAGALSAPPSASGGNGEGTGGAFSWIDQLAVNPEAVLLRRGRRVAEQLEPPILENPAVAETFTVVGTQGNPLQGKIYVKLKGDRQGTTQTVQTEVRETLPAIPRVTTRVENILFVQTGDDTPLKLALLGEDLDVLQATGETLREKVAALPGLTQVTLTGAEPESTGIVRLRGQRAVYLNASLLPDSALGDLTQQVTAIAEGLLPEGVALSIQGESARVGSVFREFALAFGLSILGMAAIFLGLFRRLLEPMVVLLSLPLSIVGAMLGLLLTQSEFGMISLIGLIFLLGLLDKNAILLIDYANQLRHQGLSRRDALLQTGHVRLRPILMTTSSTILGMLPLALGLGAGAELRQPMAIAIIGGLFTSSVLSLVVVPVLYSLLDDMFGRPETKTENLDPQSPIN
ncbi:MULTISPECIES: efflux RND transporter permease subunit [unclassified Synechocystis]|uniref:efflux RND transporter permease subunit n=1 Tax=unclassified Synechocystis TaxID=2640012 RepID=UPI000403A2E7|nr:MULTISPECIES: efflux RND transporter permease subunit [unclassified Synechocystis]AIE75219.1 Cobalt-zinc-cadmium resistance protein CzcA; Cation efflux system protein CusA [Synechocystis sp. PCC 6714]MCT0252970.1 efflux RND transporter permease subunit [Synechocystis sp. CS-94]